MAGKGFVARRSAMPIGYNRKSRYAYLALPKRLRLKLLDFGVILGYESRYTVTLTLTVDDKLRPILTLTDWDKHMVHQRKSKNLRHNAIIPEGYQAVPH
jgi:hypothetical protein